MKTKAVIEVEYTYKDLNLNCIEIVKSLEKRNIKDYFGFSRTYVIPTQIYYRFSYIWNNTTREIEIIRKNGNSHTLSSNIRVEIIKQLSNNLKNMENITTKGVI